LNGGRIRFAFFKITHRFIKDEEIWFGVNVIFNPNMNEDNANNILGNSLFYIVENAPDESDHRIITHEWKFGVHFLFRTPKRLKSGQRKMFVVWSGKVTIFT
jgi:hypothetical protein